MSTETKPKRKAVRRVFGRRRDVVGEHLYIFELTKTGLSVRRRGTRKVKAMLLGFEQLAHGLGLIRDVGGIKYSFAFGTDGVDVRRAALRDSRTVKWEELVNLGNKQPFLFPEFVVEESAAHGDTRAVMKVKVEE